MERVLRLLVIALVLGVAATSGDANAQALDWGEEYAKRIKATEATSPLGDGMFGDQVSLFNGTVSFSVTDISVPGNSALPVQLTRTFDTQDVSSPRPAGAWDIEAPYLVGVHPERAAVGHWAPLQRCSTVAAPPNHVVGLYTFLPSDYWSGTQLRGGSGGGDLLSINPDPRLVKPATATPYKWMTKGQWYFSCLPSLQSGHPGEGFVGHAPDGTQYTFNWMVVRDYAGISKQDPSRLQPVAINRKSVRLYATEVKDRFGNWVRYDWTGGRLNRIHANDGREIVLAYDTGGQLLRASTPATLTTPARTWTYQYQSPSVSTLVSVTNPDGNRWQYASQGPGQLNHIEYQADPRNPQAKVRDDELYCAPTHAMLVRPAGFTIIHPSGARAQFNFAPLRHGKTNARFNCLTGTDNNYLSDYNISPTSHDVMSLRSKVVSGPGLATQTIAYDYASLGGGYRPVNPQTDLVTGATPPPHYKYVTVTEPDGTQQVHTFGKDSDLNEGQLLRVDTIKSGVTYRSLVNTYLTESEAQGQAFPDWLGSNFVAFGDRFNASGNRPVKATTTTQDGVAFTSATQTFDAFVRSLSVTKGSSLGYAKTELTSYHDNLSSWVLGQVASTTLTQSSLPLGLPNAILSRTDYDPVTVQPLRSYAFERLQQTLTYHSDGSLASVSDGRDGAALDTTIGLGNWNRGIPQFIQFPATPDQPGGASQSAVVDDNGWIRSVTDPNGYTTAYDYDDVGRLTRIDYPTGDSTAWNSTHRSFAPYTLGARHGLPAGHWQQTTSTGNARKVTYFDALWRPLIEETYDAVDPANTRSVAVKRYDPSGRLVFQGYPQRSLGLYDDPALTGVRTEYDALDRAVATKQDSERGVLTTSTEYLPGFQTRVTLPKWQGAGVATTTSYLAWDQPTTDLPISIAHPEGAYTDILRNALGTPTRLTRRNSTGALAVNRHYVYGIQNQLCKTVEPETGATIMAYDAAHNLYWSASGQAATSTSTCDQASVPDTARVYRLHDARNRLKSLQFPDTRGSQEWTYQADGLPWQVRTTNVPGTLPTVNTYDYNHRRLLTSESVLQGAFFTFSVGYGYDANGSLASQAYPSGHSVTYAPNALGQATQVASTTAGATYASSVAYYPNGAIASFTYGNGIVHSMRQNARQLPESVQSSGGVLQLGTTFDANGNVETIDDQATAGRQSRTLQYDRLDRLVRAQSPMFGTDPVAEYGYNALDDLVRVKAAGRDHAYHYDGSRRLHNITDATGVAVVGLGYDVRGNLQNKSGQLFDFDIGNRLREASGSNLQERYRYDAHGRRVLASRNIGPPETIGVIFSQYANSGQLLYQENLRPGVNKNIDQIYLGGSLIAQREVARAGGAVTVKYQHTDALGSPVAATNTAGAVLERMEYEPYGQVIGGSRKDGPGYTGHVLDAATGMNYMQQRYYDPGIGRFMSVDPVAADTITGENFNRYKYAGLNPYRFADPDGRRDWDSLSAHATNLTGSGVGFRITATVRSPGPVGSVEAGRGNLRPTVSVRTEMKSEKTTLTVNGTNAGEWPSKNDVSTRALPGAAGPYESDDSYPTSGPYRDDADAYGPNDILKTDDVRVRWLHGGGTGLRDPSAPKQGWKPTMGCTRMQNDDIQELVSRVREIKETFPGIRVPYSRVEE